MESWWLMWDLSRIKEKEMIEEAEWDRLRRRKSPRLPGFIAALLGSLGRLLTGWGCHLQMRYGHAQGEAA
jgi:hypothetical protein